MLLDRFCKSLHVVAAFEQTDATTVAILVSDVQDEFRQCSKVFRLKLQRTDWVEPMGIKTGADDYEFWSAPFCAVSEKPLKLGKKLASGRSVLDRKIEDCPQALSCPGFFARAASRIKRKSMRRQKIDLGIIVEDVLGPVSVMNVPIDDQHSRKFVLSHSLSRSNRRVVEQAKPHRIVGQRVMTRWPSQTTGSRILFFQNSVDGVARRPGSSQRHVKRLWADNCVGLNSSAALLRKLPNSFDMPCRVNSGKLLDRCRYDLS